MGIILVIVKFEKSEEEKRLIATCLNWKKRNRSVLKAFSIEKIDFLPLDVAHG